MVGRSPEYLGRKVGAREMKLAMLALLVHPIMILGPSGLFAATTWGTQAVSNPGAHGLSQIVFQFSSSSANNGAAFNGLGVTYGFNDNPNPAPTAVPWDIAGGLVMLFARYVPIIAPMALAAGLGRKKPSPITMGTLRDDTPTFGFCCSAPSSSSGRCSSCPSRSSDRWPSTSGRSPSGGSCPRSAVFFFFLALAMFWLGFRLCWVRRGAGNPARYAVSIGDTATGVPLHAAARSLRPRQACASCDGFS